MYYQALCCSVVRLLQAPVITQLLFERLRTIKSFKRNSSKEVILSLVFICIYCEVLFRKPFSFISVLAKYMTNDSIRQFFVLYAYILQKQAFKVVLEKRCSLKNMHNASRISLKNLLHFVHIFSFSILKFQQQFFQENFSVVASYTKASFLHLGTESKNR